MGAKYTKMFTGIVESLGTVENIVIEQSNKIFTISSLISRDLKIDQSLSHNGVCLTVTKVLENSHTVCAINETLDKTDASIWKVGDQVNLERCLPMNGRLDGHLVQGHVDQTGICVEAISENGSWIFGVEYDATLQNITVEKGSICVNGVSLTVVNSKKGYFSVAIIPYTFENTNFKSLHVGALVNLEFDIIGKYIKKYAMEYLSTGH